MILTHTEKMSHVIPLAIREEATSWVIIDQDVLMAGLNPVLRLCSLTGLQMQCPLLSQTRGV